MIMTQAQLALFKTILDVAQIIKVDEKKHTVDILTEGGRRFYNVPFVYQYIYSSPYTTKDSFTTVSNVGGTTDMSALFKYNEGEGLLFMPQGGETVVIVYIKRRPFILGFILENVVNQDKPEENGDPNMTNKFNKADVLPGEFRMQARDGAYIHIRRNRTISIYANDLCQIILSKIENMMKVFLENAELYFNVGHVLFSTEKDGTTDYESWFRKNKTDTKTYLKTQIGNKANILQVMLKKDDVEKFYLKIDTDGNIELRTQGNVNAFVEGNVDALVNGAGNIHFKKELLIKSDKDFTLIGQNIFENP